MSIDIDAIRASVLKMLRVNLGFTDGERLLVVTDIPTAEHWQTLSKAMLQGMAERSLLARSVVEIAREGFPGSQVRFLAYPSTGQSGKEPPSDVGRSMKDADVVVILTSFSLSHTEAREGAFESGARVASMPRFEAGMFAEGGAMAVDYREVAAKTRRIAEVLTKAKEARVCSPTGTDISFSLETRSGAADDGLYSDSGSWGNLPAGEAYISPVEGTANGTIVVEPGWQQDVTEPMCLTFENGLVTNVEGGNEPGRSLHDLLAIGSEPNEDELARRNLAELGIGTNPNASRTDLILEAEKIASTVHLAIGDNSHFGGKVAADHHRDFVVFHPTLVLDGKKVMEDGKWLA